MPLDPRTEPVCVENIAHDLDTIARITAPNSGPGVTRLAMTPYERAAHRLMANRLESFGLDVTTDAFGNTIAVLPSNHRDGTSTPRVGTGSHLDSVPNAGRFDGIIGVVAAVEAARLISRSPVPRPFDLVVTIWANEEGARFTQACNGSRAAAGTLSAGDLDRLIDSEGVTLREAMEICDLRPDELESARWTPENWHGFVELHCEQGAVLESEGLTLGVVDRVSCSSRFRVEFSGVASHSGGTPMSLRRDARMASAEWMVEGERIAIGSRSELRVTFGQVEVTPNAITTVPGHASVWVDVRDVDENRMDETVKTLKDAARRIGSTRGCQTTIEQLARIGATDFDQTVVHAIIHAVEELGYPTRVLHSGASHDAQVIAGTVPTGMIFVPSIGGISHAPAEDTRVEDIAVGTEVLIRALWNLGTSRVASELN